LLFNKEQFWTQNCRHLPDRRSVARSVLQRPPAACFGGSSKWQSARGIVFPANRQPGKATLLQRFRDQANPEHGLPGLVEELHLPLGVFPEFAGNAADHVAANPGQLLPGGIVVGQFGAMVQCARAGLISDAGRSRAAWD
jgi:hypothetical protein